MSGELPLRFGKFELIRRLPPVRGEWRFEARLAGFQGAIEIRRVAPELLADPTTVSGFMEVGKLSALLTHRTFPRVYELGFAEAAPGVSEPYVAQELVEGLDLESWLDLANQRRIRLPIWFGPHVIAEVGNAVAMVHGLLDVRGLPVGASHQRLCPKRISITPQGEVRITDHGALLVREAGEPGYAAPEQVSARFDGRVDVYALAVILCETLTQRRLDLANREPPSRSNAAVPPELDAAAMRGLVTSVEHRTPSAMQLASELAGLLLRFRPPVQPSELVTLLRAVQGQIDPRALGLEALPANVTWSTKQPLPAPAKTHKPAVEDLVVASTPSGTWNSILAGPDPSEGPTVAISLEPPRKSVPPVSAPPKKSVPPAAESFGWGDLAGEDAKSTSRSPSPPPTPTPAPKSAEDLFESQFRSADEPLDLEAKKLRLPAPEPDRPVSKLPDLKAPEPVGLKLPDVSESPRAKPIRAPVESMGVNPLDFSQEAAAPTIGQPKPPPVKAIAVGAALVLGAVLVLTVPKAPGTTGPDAGVTTQDAQEAPGVPAATAPVDAGETAAEVEEEEEPAEEAHNFNPILTVISSPTGATVEVDGGFVGSTPLVLKHTFPVGKSVQVRVLADGHQPFEQTVTVDETGALNVNAELVAGTSKKIVMPKVEEAPEDTPPADEPPPAE